MTARIIVKLDSWHLPGYYHSWSWTKWPKICRQHLIKINVFWSKFQISFFLCTLLAINHDWLMKCLGTKRQQIKMVALLQKFSNALSFKENCNILIEISLDFATENQFREWSGLEETGLWFNIKMPSYQYRKSHYEDKTILRPSYLHSGISYTGKMTYLYWISALIVSWTNDDQ